MYSIRMLGWPWVWTQRSSSLASTLGVTVLFFISSNPLDRLSLPYSQLHQRYWTRICWGFVLLTLILITFLFHSTATTHICALWSFVCRKKFLQNASLYQKYHWKALDNQFSFVLVENIYHNPFDNLKNLVTFLTQFSY